jgi:hypothetical protein
VGTALVRLGHASEDDVAWALSSQLQTPYVHLSPEIVDPAAVERLPVRLARRLGLCPVIVAGDEITVAMADPTDEVAVAEVERRSGLRVSAAIALASNIEATLAALESRAAAPDGAPMSPALRFHLSAAATAGAEEIYFEPHPSSVRIRYRTVSGLVAGQGPPVEVGALDELARLPQPVSLPIPIPGHAVDVELRVAPTPYGTAVFGTLATGMDARILPEGLLAQLSKAMRRPGVLVVGSPDSLPRQVILRALAADCDARTRALIAGTAGRLPAGNAVDLLAADPDLITHTRAEFVFADAGCDLNVAATLIAGRRPGQVLVLGTSHMRAAHAVEDLATRAGRLKLLTALAGVVCVVRVPALCRCATEQQGTPAGWPEPLTPARWAAPAGCDDCRQTGYQGHVMLHEWYPTGPELEQALAEASPLALADRIGLALAPSLAQSARETVERLQATPEAVRDLLEA